MPRNKIIMIPTQRPRICAECPMLGKRPEAEIPFGCKFTHICLLPGMNEKLIAGRGTRAEDKQLKFRCKPLQYMKAVVSYGGDIPISPTKAKKYGMQQLNFIFEKREQ